MIAIEIWLRSVLSAVGADDRNNFSGLGLVFYTDRTALPVHPLVSAECGPDFPVTTLQESIALIGRISRRTSVFHDGFHLVDAKTLFITDLSQFLSPPIPLTPLSVERTRGARHMAARLASLLPAVALTAVFTRESETTLYERGKERTLEIRSLGRSSFGHPESARCMRTDGRGW